MMIPRSTSWLGGGCLHPIFHLTIILCLQLVPHLNLFIHFFSRKFAVGACDSKPDVMNFASQVLNVPKDKMFML